MAYVNKNCERCGEKMYNVCGNRRYCDNCINKGSLRSRINYARRKEEQLKAGEILARYYAKNGTRRS